MGYDVCEEYLHIIKAKIKEGDYEGAIYSANRLVNYNSDLALAYYYRGICHYALSDFTSSITDYQKALSLSLNFPKAKYNMGLAKYRLGFMTEAIGDIREAQIDFFKDKMLEEVKKCTETILALGSEDRRK